ncbi:MAG: CVNH domain-containing protein [Novosphingobium sp.]
MKKLVLACALTFSAAVAGGALMTPVSAQPWDGGGNWNGLPDGSWRESCRYPQTRGGYLSAECRTTYDRWVRTSIDTNRCRGNVANNDGRLVCERSGGGWYPGGGWNLPGGSYRQSCRYPTMRGTYLSAQCRDANDRWMNSQINVRSCRSGNFENGNGRLYCEGSWGGGNGGWNGGMPGGSWRDSCRDADVRGDQLYAQCRNGSGYWNGSSISLRNCRSNRIANREGRLVCEY